jgi:hypothetical protein
LAREYVTLFASKDGQSLLRKHCRRVGLEVASLRQLVDEVIEKDSMAKRAGLWQAFDDILDSPGDEPVNGTGERT